MTSIQVDGVVWFKAIYVSNLMQLEHLYIPLFISKAIESTDKKQLSDLCNYLPNQDMS